MPSNHKQNFERVSRRAVLGTAAAMAATSALAAECPIGSPAHEKGPKVWMDMDQVELDAAYDQSAYAPLIGQIQKRFATSSETTRTRLENGSFIPLSFRGVRTADTQARVCRIRGMRSRERCL